jgi:hypothetical protein
MKKHEVEKLFSDSLYALFSNVNAFETLNFFLLAERQLHGDYILLLLIMQSSEAAFHHIM